MKPGHHTLQIATDLPRGHRRAGDHHHLQPQLAGGVDLGLRARAACVFGDQNFGAVTAHQGQIIGQRKRASRHFDPRTGQREIGQRRIHDTQQEIMLRKRGERRQVQTPDSQKHPGGGALQRLNGALDIRNILPPIARLGLPGRAFKGAKRHGAQGCGLNRIGADLGGKGVRGIDNLPDVFRPQILGQPRHPAKAAHPNRDRLGARLIHAARIRQHRRQPLTGQFTHQGAGLSRAAKNKSAFHD